MKKILWPIVGILVLALFPIIRFVSNTVDSLNDCKCCRLKGVSTRSLTQQATPPRLEYNDADREPL
jgi:hypothetical protein